MRHWKALAVGIACHAAGTALLIASPDPPAPTRAVSIVLLVVGVYATLLALIALGVRWGLDAHTAARDRVLSSEAELTDAELDNALLRNLDPDPQHNVPGMLAYVTGAPLRRVRDRLTNLKRHGLLEGSVMRGFSMTDAGRRHLEQQ